MDVNSILCVGRPYNDCYTNRSVVRVIEPKQPSRSFKSGQSEPRILPVTPSRNSRRDLSSPAKSILRSKSPNYRNGSLSPSRNVRFSDRNRCVSGENCSVFGKVHVQQAASTRYETRMCQTDMESGSSQPMARLKSNTVMSLAQRDRSKSPPSVRPKPLPYQTKTSTPRYSPNRDAPVVDFDNFNVNRPKSPVQTSKNKPDTSPDTKGKIQITASTQHSYPGYKQTSDKSSRGLQSIMNKDAERKRPLTTTSMLDGKRIIQNMILERDKEPVPVEPDYAHIETQTTFDDIPDGNRIIRNLENHKSINSSFTTEEDGVYSVTASTQTGDNNPPDGRRIIRNLDISMSPRSLSPVRNTAQTQTDIQMEHENQQCGHCGYGENMKLALSADDSNESLRSQSPDCELMMDGNDEIDSNFRDYSGMMKSVAAQTDDLVNHIVMPKMDQSMKGNLHDGKRNAATSPRERRSPVAMEPSPYVRSDSQKATTVVQNSASKDCPKVQSIDVQVSMDESTDTSNDHDEPAMISTGVQWPEPEVKVPDGNSIIKNMERRQQSPLRPHEKKINDQNWKEFVNGLDIPDASTHDSFELKDVKQPDIVLEQKKTENKLPTEQRVELKPCERLSEHSARFLLENDIITKQQYEQILTAEIMKMQQQRRAPTQTMSSKYVSPHLNRHESQESRVVRRREHSVSPSRSYGLAERKSMPLTGTSRNSERDLHMADLKSKNTIQLRTRSSSLGFTPIETYSFKPETLQKMATSTLKSTRSRRDKFEPTLHYKPKPKECRNSFIRSLDLGPAPLQSKLSSTRRLRASGYTQRSPVRSSLDIQTFSYMPCQRRKTSSLDRSPKYSEETNKSKSDSSYSVRWNNRSLSAPAARKHYQSFTTLTPSLNQMRNTVARKYTSNRLDLNYHEHKTTKGSTELTSGSRLSRYDRYHYPNLSNEEALLRRWATSPPRSPSSADVQRILSMNRSKSPISRPSSTEPSSYLYLDALNDSYNRRPTSPEVSPVTASACRYKRSRRNQSSPSPKRQYDSSFEADREVKTFVGGNTSDDEKYVSLDTSRSMQNSSQSSKLCQKPPLPKMSTAKPVTMELEQPGTCNLGTIQVNGREPNSAASLKHDKPDESENTDQVPNKSSNAKPSLGTNNIISVGKAPDGLQNNACVFLGQDTIQKIIEEAKL